MIIDDTPIDFSFASVILLCLRCFATLTYHLLLSYCSPFVASLHRQPYYATHLRLLRTITLALLHRASQTHPNPSRAVPSLAPNTSTRLFFSFSSSHKR